MSIASPRLRLPRKPLLLAHRGASYLAPENTLAAFKRYQTFKADGTEFDVQICRSGELVVFHDDTPARTTNFKIRHPAVDPVPKITDLSWTQLRDLDAGGWKGKDFTNERIPLLSEVLEITPADHLLDIEYKLSKWLPPSGAAKILWEFLKAKKRTEMTVVSSFNPLFLWSWKRLKTGIPMGLISERTPNRFRNRDFWLHRLDPEVLYLEAYPEMARELEENQNAGRRVMVWTVDDIERMRDYKNLGVDGIISNRPELFSQIK